MGNFVGRLRQKRTGEALSLSASGRSAALPLVRDHRPERVAALIRVVAPRSAAEGAPARSLADLARGEEGVVDGLSPECRGAERGRLLDLGFVPGSRVRAELQAPAGGPIAFVVRDSLIALRRRQAELVQIAKKELET